MVHGHQMIKVKGKFNFRQLELLYMGFMNKPVKLVVLELDQSLGYKFVCKCYNFFLPHITLKKAKQNIGQLFK